MKRVLDEKVRRGNIITIRLTDSEMAAVVDLAWNQRRSVANLAREAIFSHLKTTYNVQPALESVQQDQTAQPVQLQEVKTI